MYMEGLLIGMFCYVMIHIFYPFVKKQNSYLVEKAWPFFLITGIGSMIGAVFVQEFIWSAILAVTGIMFLWSMSEMKENIKNEQKRTLHINEIQSLCDTTEEHQNSEV